MAEQVPFAPDAQILLGSDERCPCVLLIDNSGSMGEIVHSGGQSLGYTIQQDGQTYNAVSGGVSRIDLVNEGLRAFHTDLLSDPLAMKRVEVSVITFGGRVETVSPFTLVRDFAPPTLQANGETPLGDAILQAIAAVHERKQFLKQHSIDYLRPWIFLITDGAPTDGEKWKDAALKIHEGEEARKFSLFPVAVDGADLKVMQELSKARQPLRLKGMSFREMFLWLSTSLRAVSSSKPGQEHTVPLASPAGWAHL